MYVIRENEHRHVKTSHLPSEVKKMEETKILTSNSNPKVKPLKSIISFTPR